MERKKPNMRDIQLSGPKCLYRDTQGFGFNAPIIMPSFTAVTLPSCTHTFILPSLSCEEWIHSYVLVCNEKLKRAFRKFLKRLKRELTKSNFWKNISKGSEKAFETTYLNL